MTPTNRRFSIVTALAVLSLSTLTIADDPSTHQVYVGNPAWFACLDAAGFSDWIYWGSESENHPYNYHEVLSGEWGAAIYYDGVASDPKAMWLTDLFRYPDWATGSSMTCNDIEPSWDNTANPVPPNNLALPYMGTYWSRIAHDTAQTVIADSRMHITVDYEIVDLGFGDPNLNTARSPLAFRKLGNPEPFCVYSDRYVLLQTYSFTNKDPNNVPIQNIEFYQMLHSHGADEPGPYLSTVYDTTPFFDPLSLYVPYNSVHTVGNFRYDITQWNDPPVGSWRHRDFVGFSSTLEPDWIDADVYQGGHFSDHHYKPPVGTHINIEERDLNDLPDVYADEVAGAMGWYLGDLDPNETVSMTVAFMFGHGEPAQPSLFLDKYDNIEGCGITPGSPDPNDYTITYTIEYANPVTDVNDPDYLGPVTDVIIRDTLPPEIDPLDVIVSDGGTYDWFTRIATWNIGTLDPGQSGYVTVTVIIPSAEPLTTITNTAVLDSAIGWTADTETTPVCCWGGDIIYVAAGNDGVTGTNWADAYGTLEQALARAARNCGNEIWVATGTYTPPSNENNAFNISDGLQLYGGFAGTETARNQRDFVKHPTILDGLGQHRAVLEPNQAGYATTIIDGAFSYA